MTVTYSVVWGPQWGFAPPDNIHHAAPQCPTPPHKPTTSPIWDISDFGYFNSLHKKIAGPYPGQALHAMQMEKPKK